MHSRLVRHTSAKLRRELRTVGEVIKQARLKSGLTQFEVMHRSGISATTVRAAERGDPGLRSGIVVALMGVVGVQLAVERSEEVAHLADTRRQNSP